jgi:hypothetical protein
MDECPMLIASTPLNLTSIAMTPDTAVVAEHNLTRIVDDWQLFDYGNMRLADMTGATIIARTTNCQPQAGFSAAPAPRWFEIRSAAGYAAGVHFWHTVRGNDEAGSR